MGVVRQLETLVGGSAATAEDAIPLETTGTYGSF
jgi:hypothetical protein